MNKKVLVQMSGGVDSSVAALLLLKRGYDVSGVTMRLRPNPLACDKDIEDARKVCEKIGINHMTFDFTDIFNKLVIENFVSEYKKGRTPNPCIVCNHNIKFGLMVDKAISMGFDYIATGHYANLKFDERSNRYLIHKSASTKDQSYVLYNMTQFQLKHTMFPLGDLDKTLIRKIAKEEGLVVASKKDSQDICFIENGKYVSFIENFSNVISKEGDFISSDGSVLGKHQGIYKYTIGQRRGLGIQSPRPLYVTKIDPVKNIVKLGQEKDLYSSTSLVTNANFIPFDILECEMTVEVKTRYHAKPAKAKISRLDDKVLVEFKEPQRAVTKGQSMVFYQGDLLVGGGIIY